MFSDLQSFCLIVALMFSAVFVFAVGAKLLEVYRARDWVAATGRVTRSRVRTRKNPSNSDDDFQSEPFVTYEYSVAGKEYRASRINFAERIGGDEIDTMLKKYPVGKVVRVYYNPANPGQAVLEKEMPSWIVAAVAGLVIVCFAGALIAPFVLDRAAFGLANFLPHPERAPLVTMLGGMGLLAALVAYAMQRQVSAARVWSVTSGRVLDTSIQAREHWDSDGRYSPLYDSSIVYIYTVNGREYISNRVALGGKMSSSVSRRPPAWLKGALGKYPVGASVQVYYDPKNPDESALELRANGMWFVLSFAAAFWILALIVANLG